MPTPIDNNLIFTAAPGSEPFEVLRAGSYLKGGQRIEISEADLDRAVANFASEQRRGAEIPVDYDHSFAEGGGSKAAGWFTELVRRGRALWARVSWTPDAAEMIASGEYRYFSPEFSPHASDEHGEGLGFTILAGALTNRPFLRGMTPVALSQAHAEDVERLTAEIGELRLRDDVDPESLALHERAVALMRDRGLDYADALTASAREENR